MDSFPLVTLTEVKEFMEVRAEITAKDARYTRLVDTATKMIERETGRSFAKQVHVEYHTARDNTRTDYNLGGAGDFSTSGRYTSDSGLKSIITPQTIYLRGVNIDPDADFKVWYDPSPSGSDAYGDNNLLTLGDDYVVDYDNDAVVLYIGTTYRPRSIKVEYTAGYEVADSSLSGSAPEELKTACLIQTQYLNVKLRNDNIGMDSERTVSAKDRVTMAPFMARAGLTPEVVGMVRHLKRLRTGKG